MAIADAPAKLSAAGRIGRELGAWPPSLKIGGALFLAMVLAGIFAPLLTPYDPYYQDYNAILLPPSWAHPFGTDMNGRDILTRVLFGIRIDLQISFITTFVPMTYGVFIGAVSGYLGGKLDTVLMRILDIAIAFPFLVLIIVIIAILGPGVHNIYVAVFLVGWTMYARLARAEMLVERDKDYVLAARVLGFGQGRVMFGHALPNIINSSIVFAMSDFVLNILLLSGLSLPRPRRRAAGAGMGRDDRREQGLHAPGLVGDDHAGAGHRADRHGAQPDRRRAGPAPRPEPPEPDVVG